MASEGHVCPVCGQPVETVVRRHKTLGAWVPRWVAGPCRNPKCEAYADEGTEGIEDDGGTEDGGEQGGGEPAGQKT